MAVTVIPNRGIPDIGQAALINGKPAILFNSAVAARFPLSVGEFFLYHECGHHALGHTLVGGIPIINEQAADCWAVRTLTSSGGFNSADVDTVQAAIARFGRSDWSHLPGPIRSINLRSCLEQSSTPPPKPPSDEGSQSPRPDLNITCKVSDSELDAEEISATFLQNMQRASESALRQKLDQLREDVAYYEDQCRDYLRDLRLNMDRLNRHYSESQRKNVDFDLDEVHKARDQVAKYRARMRAVNRELVRR